MRNKTNLKKLVVAVVCIMSIITSSSSAFAASATFTDTLIRGQEYVACVKNTITWTTENVNFTITASDGWQVPSGLLVSAGGVRKLSTSTIREIYYNYTTTFLAGAVIFGQTIGYRHDYIDQCHVFAGAAYEWTTL